MKKASGIIALSLTVFMLLGTILFYIYKNAGTGPLHIRTLTIPGTAVAEQNQTDPVVAGLININTADVQQLATLPGIGSALAQRIVDYRTQNGPFLSPAGLLNVQGIGEKKLEQILELITTGGST